MRQALAATGAWLALACAAAPDAGPVPFEARDTADGVSCRRFDGAVEARWPGGETPAWEDAAGTLRGPRAYDTLLLDARQAPMLLRWNALGLVKVWRTTPASNHGLMVVSPKSASVEVHAREAEDVALRPALRIVFADGGVEWLSPVADAALDCSTAAGLGAAPAMRIGPQAPAYLRFDLTRLRHAPSMAVSGAELILSRKPGSSPLAGPLVLQGVRTPWGPAFSETGTGLAASHPGDRGIEQDPAVIFADRFEAGSIQPPWNLAQAVQSVVFRDDDAGTPGSPAGNRLRVTIPRSENLGLDLRYDFRARMARDPDEIYLRYYLRLGPEWADTPDAGKLPGLAGTYGRAAWGGRGWDGRQGWSARGAFLKAPPSDHPAAGRVILGSYVYHGRAQGSYGEVFAWSGSGGAAYLRPERWYCVEQYIRLNTPGRDDGVLRAWVDGQPVFETRDLRLRDVPGLKIENAWFNFYIGGTQPALRHMTAWVDNVVIATRPIGPIAR